MCVLGAFFARHTGASAPPTQTKLSMELDLSVQRIYLRRRIYNLVGGPETACNGLQLLAI